MKKLLPFLVSLLCIVGCEEEGQNTGDYTFDSICMVQYVNENGDGTKNIVLQDGNVLFVDNSVLVLVQRGSCSGFSPEDVNSFKPGVQVRYFYIMDEVDFSGNPTVFYPVEVNIYEGDCIIYEQASNNPCCE